ncbi:MAG: hypothetical protein JSR17_12620 [Proteobacteria bacterium]|nr:hypothetical protein [Pseudomonadota bacterium]
MKLICRSEIQAKTLSNTPVRKKLFKIGQAYIALALKIEPFIGPSVLIEVEEGVIVWAELVGFECETSVLCRDWDFHQFGKETWCGPKSWMYTAFFRDLEKSKPIATKLFEEEKQKTHQQEINSPWH